MYLGLPAGLFAFILQFVLPSHVDSEKAARSDRIAVRTGLYRSPPADVLTERGLILHRLFRIDGAIFIACVLLTFILSWFR